MTLRLYPFQREGVEYALKHHYSINACEMGLGKTVQAIATGCKAGGYILVICPAYLINNWINEFNKFCGKGSGFAGYSIFSYEQFTKLIASGEKGSWLEEADIAVFDEAHYLKNMNAKRTKAAHKFVKECKPEYLLLLTGTPIKNRVCEFYSLLKLCSYNPKGTSGLPITKGYWHFADKLSHRHDYKLANGIKVVKHTGLKNKPLLLKYLKGKYFRRTAKDELDLPGITRSYLSCNIDRGLESQLAAEFDEGNSHISTAKKETALAKAEYTIGFANELFDQDIQPLLIFTDHVGSADAICKGLGGGRSGSRRGYSITGATSSEKRANLVAEFQAGGLDYLVCTIGSMSTGFTLTRTNRIIFNDLSWCPADNAQAEARIHRIGQREPCFVVYMVSEGIDEQITQTLQEKMKVLDAAL
jgi:SWI/SNF-related matrix-associated actin-dependent regulator 1 of chromatin subfamily A